MHLIAKKYRKTSILSHFRSIFTGFWNFGPICGHICTLNEPKCSILLCKYLIKITIWLFFIELKTNNDFFSPVSIYSKIYNFDIFIIEIGQKGAWPTKKLGIWRLILVNNYNSISNNQISIVIDMFFIVYNEISRIWFLPHAKFLTKNKRVLDILKWLLKKF